VAIKGLMVAEDALTKLIASAVAVMFLSPSVMLDREHVRLYSMSVLLSHAGIESNQIIT